MTDFLKTANMIYSFKKTSILHIKRIIRSTVKENGKCKALHLNERG